MGANDLSGIGSGGASGSPFGGEPGGLFGKRHVQRPAGKQGRRDKR